MCKFIIFVMWCSPVSGYDDVVMFVCWEAVAAAAAAVVEVLVNLVVGLLVVVVVDGKVVLGTCDTAIRYRLLQHQCVDDVNFNFWHKMIDISLFYDNYLPPFPALFTFVSHFHNILSERNGGIAAYFLLRDAMLTRYLLSWCVSLSVCLYVGPICRYCIETAKHKQRFLEPKILAKF